MSVCLHSYPKKYSTNVLVISFPGLPLPWWLSGKEPTCQCRRYGFNPWVRKIAWRRKWQLPTAFLPGKSHGGLQSIGLKRIRHDLASKEQQELSEVKPHWLWKEESLTFPWLLLGHLLLLSPPAHCSHCSLLGPMSGFVAFAPTVLLKVHQI